MANGAIYDDAGNTVPIHEQKLDALEDIIESANGKPLLVAYWYQHDLERIMKRLHDRHIPFSKLDKADSIRRWNNGEIPVALIHPASAGHGLNLQTGGNTIVWFGLTWSLELYSQTIARLWRQGQTAETVVVQHTSDGAPEDERLEEALAEERTLELESELEQDEHPRDYTAELEDEEEEAAPTSEKRLKREIRAEALRRLEEAARTESDFLTVVDEWNKLDRNRERRERDHENLRGDVPLEFQAVPEPRIVPL